MGLNIADIVPKKDIGFPKLKGRVVAVDASNIIYQFLSTIRQRDGQPLMDSEGNVTSHLSGLFYRNINLMNEGMRLVYVFDGESPKLKGKTHKKREETKQEAKKNYEEAKKKGKEKDMLKYSKQLAKLTPRIAKESKDLLTAMGIQCVQAPGEGEAQAAHLCKQKRIYSVGSQDYDSLLFGGPKLIQNLTLARKRKMAGKVREVNPQLIELERVLNRLQINEDQLICLGILVGTDYNPRGVEGIGQKTALKIVKSRKYPVKIFQAVEDKIKKMSEKHQFDWQEVFELFHKPNVKDVDIDFPNQDKERIKQLLLDRDFSEKRIDSGLKRLRKAKEEQKQQTLF